MPFDSLSEALDPEDSRLTIEGWPAPLRAVVVCRKSS
jgi:tRNA (mo5U34)-methyltransferase